MPNKPYCSNDLSQGLFIRPKSLALTHKYIQHNPPTQIQALVVDIDHDQSFCVADDEGVQLPSLLVHNHENGHGHAIYLLDTMVTTSPAARMKPQRWLAGLERGYTRRLGGDKAYTGLICRNPLTHPILDSNRIYDMSELDACLDFEDKAPYPQIEMEHGTGRNVTMFDTVRFKAYKAVREYNNDNTFFDFVLNQCEKVGYGFNNPLAFSEIKATAKSIAKWVWARRSEFGSYGEHSKNRGAMAMVLHEDLDLKQRQIAGAHYTHKLQVERTRTQIQACYDLLVSLNVKPTQRAIAEKTGLGIATVKRHWSSIKK